MRNSCTCYNVEAPGVEQLSPGKFHFEDVQYSEEKESKYAAYDRKKVTWLNGEPFDRASELALSAIVVSSQPQACRLCDQFIGLYTDRK